MKEYKLNDIKSFVLLKYQILTSNASTWILCKTYPLEVRKNWAWRCAEDVEHLARAKEAKEVYRVARLYRDGKATGKELTTVHTACIASISTANHAVYGSIYAADYAANAANAAINAVYAVRYAVDATTYATTEYNDVYATKWKLYISWLIEELCKYESTIQCITFT